MLDDNEYIEKRKEEAEKSYFYCDGLLRYKIDDYLADDKDEDGYDDTHLIAFCDIPQEAYFLKLTRID